MKMQNAGPENDGNGADGGGSNRWETLTVQPRSYGKKMFDIKHAYKESDYLKRNNTQQFRPVQGMSTTKFHAGFMRRQAATIKAEQDPEAQKKKLQEREATRDRRNNSRRDFLKNKYNVGDGNGILIGDYAPRTDQRRTRGRRHFDRPISKESELAGEIHLRQTSSRFYCEAPAGAAEKRRKEIVKEGLTWDKQSSVLGIGRSDLPSRGASDNFSNSYYLKQARAETARQADIDSVRELQ